MYKSNAPQDQTVLIDTASASGTGALTWGKTGLAYVELSGIGHICFQLTGTYSLTAQFQTSNDLTNWSTLAMQLDSGNMPVNENLQTAGASNGTWSAPVRGQRYFRINISSYTSGTVTVTLIGRAGSAITSTVQAMITGNKTHNAGAPDATANLGVLPAIATAANPSYTEGNQVGSSTDLGGNTRVSATPYPAAATPITNSSGNVANSNAVATLAAAVGKTTYITGFEITAGGATTGALVTVTVVGPVTGTMSYTFAAPTGATVGAEPLIVEFPVAIPASATNTAIVVTLPALGSGNTNATAVAHGYQL